MSAQQAADRERIAELEAILRRAADVVMVTCMGRCVACWSLVNPFGKDRHTEPHIGSCWWVAARKALEVKETA